jgi:hypothetical protein
MKLTLSFNENFLCNSQCIEMQKYIQFADGQRGRREERGPLYRLIFKTVPLCLRFAVSLAFLAHSGQAVLAASFKDLSV